MLTDDDDESSNFTSQPTLTYFYTIIDSTGGEVFEAKDKAIYEYDY